MKYTFGQIIKISEAVRKINRIFHDYEANSYEQRHPEIYKREIKNWQDNYYQYIKPIQDRKRTGITILDVGTGNGFVIESFADFLTTDDRVIFSDISSSMLKVVRKKFEKNGFKKEYLLSDASSLDLPQGSVDIVTMNSVLHHLPDVKKPLLLFGRFLSKNGAVIIRHEPNRLFAENIVLRFVFGIINFLKQGRQKESLPIKVKLLEKFSREGFEFEDNFDYQDLISIVDVRSPTARGELDKNKGFDPFFLGREYFAGYRVYINTYNFLGKVDEKSSLGRRTLSSILKSLFPSCGYLFELIAIK